MDRPSFAQAAREYAALQSNPRTRNNLVSTVRRLVAALGEEFDGRALYRWLAAEVGAGRLSHGSARTYRNRCLAIDRDRAARYGGPLRLRECPQFRLPFDSPGVLDWRDAALYERILAALPSDRWRLFVSLMRRHGLRSGEALGLEWCDFDLEAQGEVRVRQQRDAKHFDADPSPKYKSVRALPLHPETRALYLAVHSQTRTAEPARGGPRGGQSQLRYPCPFYAPELSEVMAALVRPLAPEVFREGIRGLRKADAWHVFRRTFFSEAHDRNVSLADLMLYGGHSKTQTTESYLLKTRRRRIDPAPLRAMWADERRRSLKVIDGEGGGGADA